MQKYTVVLKKAYVLTETHTVSMDNADDAYYVVASMSENDQADSIPTIHGVIIRNSDLDEITVTKNLGGNRDE